MGTGASVICSAFLRTLVVLFSICAWVPGYVTGTQSGYVPGPSPGVQHGDSVRDPVPRHNMGTQSGYYRDPVPRHNMGPVKGYDKKYAKKHAKSTSDAFI
jgi:hypothetical protein